MFTTYKTNRDRIAREQAARETSTAPVTTYERNRRRLAAARK